MERTGVMAPPAGWSGPPLLGSPAPVRTGVMTPGSCPDLDHAKALRGLLWLVAAGLALTELCWLALPGA